MVTFVCDEETESTNWDLSHCEENTPKLSGIRLLVLRSAEFIILVSGLNPYPPTLLKMGQAIRIG